MRFLVLLLGTWLTAGVAQAQAPLAQSPSAEATKAEAEAAWSTARAISPLTASLDREHAEWLAERVVDPQYATDSDEGWRDRWRRAATRDAAVGAVRIAPAALGDACIEAGLMGCGTQLGGWLNAPEGAGRLYWQIQNGSTEEDGITAGVVFLAAQADGRLAPVAWTFGGVHFEPPVLIQSGDRLYVASAGVTAGTGAFSADVLFRWTPGAARPLAQIDNETWRDAALPAMLPPGLEVWKGVQFNYAGLIAQTSLWRAGDANCCASGGEATLDFEIEGDALKLISVSPDDAVLDFVMTTPADVIAWMNRGLMCQHWGGEEGYDADRRAQITAAVTELRCDALLSDRAALERKHAEDPNALAELARVAAE